LTKPRKISKIPPKIGNMSEQIPKSHFRKFQTMEDSIMSKNSSKIAKKHSITYTKPKTHKNPKTSLASLATDNLASYRMKA
jgi:hypothetical protein